MNQTKLSRMHLYALLAFALALLLVTGGCGWRPLANSGSATVTSIAGFYQPNRTWTYQESGSGLSDPLTYTVKVGEKQLYHGYTALQVTTSVPGNYEETRQYLVFSSTVGTILGIETYNSSTKEIVDHPVLPGVRFPATLTPGYPVSSTYQTVENEVEVNWLVKTEIITAVQESVSVPAGQYKQAIKVLTRVTTTRSSVDSQSSDTSVVEEYTWYAPGVGMVKSQDTSGTRTTQLTGTSS